MSRNKRHGFTLIELSLVLVIIGLLVGGILVGQELVKAAETRATIAQMEKFNSAVNTFKNKYGYLPGDIPAAAVTMFGFSIVPGSQRAGTKGLGNGDGLIDTWNGSNYYGCDHVGGENAWFWEDLSSNAGGLIEGGFQTATANPPTLNVTTGNLGLWLPAAKLGEGNYFSVCEQGGINYFIISKGVAIMGNVNDYCSIPGMSAAQAYNIDKKMDDGLPQSGSITAQFQNNSSTCTSDGAPGASGVLVWVGAADTSATPSSPNTCYDNGGSSAGATQQYSTEVNNGSGLNCALTIQMRGAAR